MPPTGTHSITGPAGNIELIIEAPRAKALPILLLMCHPHPLYDGSMHNKVVTTTCRAMQELGMSTCRFNFRGVGKSEGEYAKGHGEQADALAVAQWLQTQVPDMALWLGGFSFGGYVAYSIAEQLKPAQLLTIAPGITRFDLQQAPEPSMPWLVIQSDTDEVIDPKAIWSWLEQHQCAYTLMKLHGVSHFFHGQLIVLRQRLVQYYRGVAHDHTA
jgi:alpha/beta superfamily hydrolase